MEPEDGGPGGVQQQTDAACRLSRSWPAAAAAGAGHHDAITLSGCAQQQREPAACGQEAAGGPEAKQQQQQPHVAIGARRDAAAAGSKPDTTATTATAPAGSNCKAPSALPSDCRRAADQQQQLQEAAAAACDMQLDVAEAADDGSGGDGVPVTRQRSLRGWQAMMFSPRQAPSGPLELPSPREAGGSSPGRHPSHDDGLPSPAAAAALLHLPPLGGSSCREQQHDGMDVDVPAVAAAPVLGAAPAALAAAARPTLVIPASPAPGGPSTTDSPLALYTPGGSLVRPYSGPRLCVDELDLDAIDDISGLDSSAGLSNSSSPVVSGGAYSGGGRGTPGSSHLRSSRDHDLRRAALMNQLLSPRPQQPPGSTTAVTAASPGSLSVQVEGPGHVPMFTGSTRARALQQAPGGGGCGGGSSSSLHSSAAASPAGSEPAQQPPSMMQQLMYNMRAPRGGGATSPSPVRPSSSLAAAAATGAMPPPAHRTPGSARASSVPSSPAPAPAHGQAAALLAGSVQASPRTPHSPLSVALSPRPCSSTRVLLPAGSVLPAPAFSGGVCDAAPHGATPGTSPGTSSVAAPSSTTSSCHTGQVAGPQVRGSLPSPAASRFGPQACLSPLPRVGSDGDLLQHQQQPQPQPLTAEQLQQFHLLAQVQQHDTRLGPHGGSPLSPSHHHHQQQPQPQRGGRGLLSPTRPSPQVPPAMMVLSLADGQLPAADPLAFAPAPAAARTAADTSAAGAAAPVGELGRDSIHEWLDHHSWRLRPDELPVGLRDAADLRDSAAAAAAVAARDTQAHVHQQQQLLGDGRTHSRASSHRSSLSQVELPLTSLGLLPAAVSTAHCYAHQQGGALSPTPGSYVQQHQQRTPASSHFAAVQPAGCSTPRAASGASGGDWHGHSTAGAAAATGALVHENEAGAASGGRSARPGAGAGATAGAGTRQQQLAHEPQRQHTRLQHVRPASLAVAGAAAAPDDDPDLHPGARLLSERLDTAAHRGGSDQRQHASGSSCTHPGAHQQHRSSGGVHGGFAPGLGRAASGRAGGGDASPYSSSSPAAGGTTAAGGSSSGSIRSRLGPAAACGAADCAASTPAGSAEPVLSPGRRPYIASSPVAHGSSLAAGAQWLQPAPPPPRRAPDVLPGIELLLQRRPQHQQRTVSPASDSSDDGRDGDDDDRDEGGGSGCGTLRTAPRWADGHSNNPVQGGGGGGGGMLHTPPAPGCCPQRRQPRSGGGLGGLLHDDRFVGRLLLSLPGVEAGAAAVQAALAELREAHAAASLLSER